MRAPLAIPALVFLAAVVVARDGSFGVACTLAVLAVVAAAVLGSRAHAVAVLAIGAGLACGWLRGTPPQILSEIPDGVRGGFVASEVSEQPWGAGFELAGDDGLRYAVSLRESPAIGERLTLRGRIEPFDEPRNPDEPSPRALAAERGLAGRIVAAHIIARKPPEPSDRRTLAPRLRERASETLHGALGEPDATILAGMLFGSRGALPPDLRAEFQDTGTVHVLVTAGLHLGVIAAGATFVLARFGVGRTSSAIAVIPVVWLYCVFSGAHLPSLRAATMATVALAARALGERAVSLNTLALAAIAVGALWPVSVGGASFDLSFSCVAAIVLFAGPIAERLASLRVPGAMREALALTIATQLGVWPLTAAVFLTISPYAVIANLFVVPVAAIALIGGVAVLAASPIPVAGTLAARIEAWPLAWIENVVHLTAALPFAHIVATPPPGWTIALYDLAMVAVAVLFRCGSDD